MVCFWSIVLTQSRKEAKTQRNEDCITYKITRLVIPNEVRNP